MAPNPYAVPRYPIATVCELKSVLSASMHFTLVKLALNLHKSKHEDQLLVPPRLPCSSELCLDALCSGIVRCLPATWRGRYITTLGMSEAATGEMSCEVEGRTRHQGCGPALQLCSCLTGQT